MSKCPFSNGKKSISDTLTFLLIFLTVLFFMTTILALPVMVLWNYVIPDVTNGSVKEINFFQALSLNILCFILFRSKSYDKASEQG
jgi:hypothetical protein